MLYNYSFFTKTKIFPILLNIFPLCLSNFMFFFLFYIANHTKHVIFGQITLHNLTIHIWQFSLVQIFKEDTTFVHSFMSWKMSKNSGMKVTFFNLPVQNYRFICCTLTIMCSLSIVLRHWSDHYDDHDDKWLFFSTLCEKKQNKGPSDILSS